MHHGLVPAALHPGFMCRRLGALCLSLVTARFGGANASSSGPSLNTALDSLHLVLACGHPCQSRTVQSTARVCAAELRSAPQCCQAIRAYDGFRCSQARPLPADPRHGLIFDKLDIFDILGKL